MNYRTSCIGLYPDFALKWPSTVQEFFDYLTFANLDVEVARPEVCI